MLSENTESLPIMIRYFVMRDMDQIMKVEQTSFSCPWTEEDFQQARCRNGVGIYVVEHGDKVIGYLVYQCHKKYIDILSMAVGPDWRSRGVGRKLLEKMIAKLSPNGRTRIKLVVRETNLGCHLFLKALHFKASKVLRHYYEDSDEDGFLFEYILSGTEHQEQQEEMEESEIGYE